MSLIASSSNQLVKICIVIDISGSKNSLYEVFAVDFGLSSDVEKVEYKSLGSPLFSVPLTYPRCMSFSAFGSCIYMFGGSITDELGLAKQDSDEVYAYDASSAEPSIKFVSRMNHRKRDPLVIGPVNGKIYVLSRSLLAKDFEQFDPTSNSCKILNQPCSNFGRYIPTNDLSNKFEVKSYMVVSDASKILLSTEFSLFSYDINLDEWNRVGSRPPSLRFEHGALSIGNDYYLALNIALGYGFSTCRYNKYGRWGKYKQLGEHLPADYYTHPFSSMSLGDGRVCAVRSVYTCHVEPDTKYRPADTCHYIKVARFLPKGRRLRVIGCHIYGFDDQLENLYRTVKNSFPLFATRTKYRNVDSRLPYGSTRNRKRKTELLFDEGRKRTKYSNVQETGSEKTELLLDEGTKRNKKRKDRASP